MGIATMIICSITVAGRISGRDSSSVRSVNTNYVQLTRNHILAIEDTIGAGFVAVFLTDRTRMNKFICWLFGHTGKRYYNIPLLFGMSWASGPWSTWIGPCQRCGTESTKT